MLKILGNDFLKFVRRSDFLGRFLNTPFEEVQIGELLYLREMKCGTLHNLYK